MAKQPAAVMDKNVGESQMIGTRNTDTMFAQRQDVLPEAPDQCTMGGVQLLVMLQKSGTGMEKIAAGMKALQKNKKASAKDVYDAIEEAGWELKIRPFASMPQGVINRENRFAGTLRKARRIMQGATLDMLAAEARRADAANSKGVVITEDDILAAGLSPEEFAKFLQNQEEKNHEVF